MHFQREVFSATEIVQLSPRTFIFIFSVTENKTGPIMTIHPLRHTPLSFLRGCPEPSYVLSI